MLLFNLTAIHFLVHGITYMHNKKRVQTIAFITSFIHYFFPLPKVSFSLIFLLFL